VKNDFKALHGPDGLKRFGEINNNVDQTELIELMQKKMVANPNSAKGSKKQRLDASELEPYMKASRKVSQQAHLVQKAEGQTVDFIEFKNIMRDTRDYTRPESWAEWCMIANDPTKGHPRNMHGPVKGLELQMTIVFKNIVSSDRMLEVSTEFQEIRNCGNDAALANSSFQELLQGQAGITAALLGSSGLSMADMMRGMGPAANIDLANLMSGAGGFMDRHSVGDAASASSVQQVQPGLSIDPLSGMPLESPSKIMLALPGIGGVVGSNSAMNQPRLPFLGGPGAGVAVAAAATGTEADATASTPTLTRTSSGEESIESSIVAAGKAETPPESAPKAMKATESASKDQYHIVLIVKLIEIVISFVIRIPKRTFASMTILIKRGSPQNETRPNKLKRIFFLFFHILAVWLSCWVIIHYRRQRVKSKRAKIRMT